AEDGIRDATVTGVQTCALPIFRGARRAARGAAGRAVKFWDSSAVVPLLVPEAMSRSLQGLYDADRVMFAWWGTEIECTSAIARRQRFGPLREDVVAEAFARLSALRAGWHEVEPG